MAGSKEIQNRMKSIRDTMKITNAMYMISSSKMKKAKAALEKTEPFFVEQQNAVASILEDIPELDSIYFTRGAGIDKKQLRRAYIVITADKGLAGAYNHNVLKMTEELLLQGDQNKLYVVGETGRQYFSRRGINMDATFHYTVQSPTLHRSRIIANQVMEDFNLNLVDEFYIVYTKMINAFKMEPQMWKLLPLVRTDFELEDNSAYEETFEYHPSVEEVLKHLVPDIISGYIYGALVESYACEQNSRMIAMQSATDSAHEMLHELEMEYNRSRQAAITQEITEVIAGAKSQKNKNS
ncbi:MAG: ATP synthase F1 subunit gamma [Eubacterium sp.]|nr:ATP synthase F1 subunit gamma [Eubacterium sp.]